MARDDGTAKTPSAWFYDQGWHELASWDQEQLAHDFRAWMNECGLHNTRGILTDPHGNTWEANHRAALHQCAGALDRADLRLVYEVARLLMLVPRAADFWDRQEARTRAILERADQLLLEDERCGR